MKCIRIFLFVFLAVVPVFANAKIFSENDSYPNIASYLKDLEEQGYCVIPQVVSTSEAEQLYERVWYEYIEKAWPLCRMDDRSNWKEAFPMHNKYGIFAGPAGQIQVMWDLRQDPRIVNIFSQLWNTNDLIVSMDGLSFMCPSEIREGFYDIWPHVDQGTIRRERGTYNNNPPIDFVSESSLKTQPFTIQGQFLFEDSLEGDAGFYCIPKSHLRFTEFAPQLEIMSAGDPRDERRKIRNRYLKEFFTENKDEQGNSYCMKHITATRGSLILWDSRTIHWNQCASKDRPFREHPKVRMVGFLSYVPKARLTDEGRLLRKKAFEEGVSTGHNPAYPELKYTKNFIEKGYEGYYEDPNYVSPKVQLTPLGESLLGL